MEFDTVDLGGIGSGSAGKHIIYRRSSGEWKLAPQLGADLEAGWKRLRGQFVAAFDAVERDAFDELDDLDASIVLSRGTGAMGAARRFTRIESFQDSVEEVRWDGVRYDETGP